MTSWRRSMTRWKAGRSSLYHWCCTPKRGHTAIQSTRGWWNPQLRFLPITLGLTPESSKRVSKGHLTSPYISCFFYHPASGGGFAKMALSAQLNEEEMEMARWRPQLGVFFLGGLVGKKDKLIMWPPCLFWSFQPRKCWQAWCVCWLWYLASRSTRRGDALRSVHLSHGWTGLGTIQEQGVSCSWAAFVPQTCGCCEMFWHMTSKPPLAGLGAVMDEFDLRIEDLNAQAGEFPKVTSVAAADVWMLQFMWSTYIYICI